MDTLEIHPALDHNFMHTHECERSNNSDLFRDAAPKSTPEIYKSCHPSHQNANVNYRCCECSLNNLLPAFSSLPLPRSSPSSSSSLSAKNPPISPSPILRLPPNSAPPSSFFRKYSSSPANASYNSPALISSPPFGRTSNS